MIVVWRVTERCNLSCPFCAYDRTLVRPRAEAERAEVLRFGAVLGDYARERGERVLVCWLGGEPLLWEPVMDVSRTFRATFGLEVGVTTNGTTLHAPGVLDAVLACVSELTVSVDGPAAVHERLRGAPGNWERLRAAVNTLSARRRVENAPLRLRANVVLMRDTLPGFAGLCRALAEWGLDEITFNQLGGRDRPAFFPAHRLTPEDARALAALVPGLRAELAARGVRLCGDERYVARIEASAAAVPLPVVDCAPGERFLFVDEGGRVAPCSFTGAELGRPLARVRTLDDLLALPAAFAGTRRVRPAAACGDCPSTQVFGKFGRAS